MRSYMLCTPQQTLLGYSNQEEKDGLGMWHEWREKRGIQEFCWGNLGEREHLEDLCVNGRINITLSL
jgi:hypothetical protein